MAKKKAKVKSGAAVEKKVNKSKAIRDFMAENPTAGPTEGSDALTKEGTPVTAAFVSTVKSTSKGKKQSRRGVGRPRGSKKAAAGDQFTVAELLQAKKLSEQMGGIEKAKAIVNALAKIS